MILQELYSKPINRAVNPAVSATKFDPETEQIEIQEYVFTDEIINGLFRILNAIKNNEPYDHVGIWIDGYYGSGKSHFLKYLDYCITPKTRDAALSRLLEAVKAIDPLDDKHNLCFDYDDLFSISNWLKKATIDTCIFNLETSYDNSTDKKKAFLHVFWNEFNGKRGFNKFNITLAQNLEKPLAEKGVFEEFKARIAEEAEADWNNPGIAADIIDNELDWVLDIAKDLAPTLDKESIRERIIKRDTNMSIERFGMELAAYLKDKGEDYRLIFLADEVSQFINKERDRYLNLQEIITKLSEACANKVWVACTAQQDLSEIMDDCHIADEKDKEGKIKGRFEVKVSLKGTQPEVITQKRILDKKEEVVPVLEEMYEKQKAAFGLQFKLPTSYSSYDSMEEFVAYYPFVPYQFKLIMQVFNSFLNLGYVAKEVKGNERSIIKVIHSTAKKNAEAPLGKFISFDELYNNMFEEGLQARGQKAIKNAEDMAGTYERNPNLAKRVANTLFMICNISQTDQMLFPASVDNITSLLINNVETPRLTIKDEVEKILDFLCQKNIIRLEQGKQGAPDTYTFYSEEEMKVAQLIQSQVPDNNMQAEQLKEIFFKYLTNLKNKESYGTRTFQVGASIKQRNFLSNNADIVVEFAMDMDYDSADSLAMNNPKNRLVYYIAPKFHDNKRLFNAFYWYCQVNSYMATPVPNETNRDTRDEFSKRAGILYTDIIAKEFQKILDNCPIISGTSVIDEIELGGKRGNERYQSAMQKHLGNIYTKAKLVDNNKFPHTTDQLKRSILRTVEPGEYDGMNAPLTTPENEVEIYLNRQYAEVNVADVLAKFNKEPYGWDNICTLYVINELVRRHNRDYSYMNSPNVETSTVAARIITESNKFTLRMAQAISPEVIQQFTNSWKDIFGTTDVFGTSDSTQLFRMSREHTSEMGLEKRLDAYRRIEAQIHQYAFVQPIQKAIHLFEKWLAVRDPLTYFNAVIKDRENGHIIMDECKEVAQFTNDFLDKYEGLLQFVKDNEFNFSLIPAELQGKVTDLKAIVEDQWPISNLRKYLRLQKEIEFALGNVRKSLREQIEKAYSDTYELLYTACKEKGISSEILANKQSVIDTKTATNNIAVLKANLNTDNFYAAEVQKIIGYKPESKVEPGDKVADDHKKEEEIEKKVVQEKVRSASLQTKTTSPLHNEEEIDAYLSKLKEQLIKLLENHDSVMIIK